MKDLNVPKVYQNCYALGMVVCGSTYTQHRIMVIPPSEIKRCIPNKVDEFCKWMNGQTCMVEGYYVDDVERFLEGRPIID